MPTRRALIASGAAATLAAGCGGREPRTIAGSAEDLPALQERLDDERAQIALFEFAAERLAGHTRDTIAVILRHDRAHAQALAQAIRELGGAPRPARDTAAAARALLPRSPREALDGLAQFKHAAAGDYEAAIPALANARLRGTFGSIMAAETEHAEALAKLL